MSYELKFTGEDVYCQVRSGDMSLEQFDEWLQVVLDDVENNGGTHTLFNLVKNNAP